MQRKVNRLFTTIHTEGALLPPDLLQRIHEGKNLDGLTPASYHRPGERLNEVINRAWNALQGAWLNFRAAQARLPPTDLGTSLTRERWLLPLFRELDYGRLQRAAATEINGRSYPLSHTWGDQVPIHLLSYQVDLDRRSRGVAGAAAASPHSLLQAFLNRSQDHLWGFLSNGYKLRLLRDNASLTRQAYLEFDLAAMFEGDVYSDFVLLWLVGHQSRLEAPLADGKSERDDCRGQPCWLERWMKVAQTFRTRARDQLRDGVETAITALGRGFLAHPDNASLRQQLQQGVLSAPDYYRQLLRLVYRLLFLFVAEDRDLLLDPAADKEAAERYRQYYSTQRLRRLAQTFKGTRHADLFAGLRLVMRLLAPEAEEGAAALGLKPLGSFLFSEPAAVIDCQISNLHLLDALRALSLIDDKQTRLLRPVDYQHLGAAELGSVYESLLELHPQIDVPARQFALRTAGGHERKTTGSYYTPESLVNALLDSALDPILAEAKQQGEAAILQLKICDPACGSGHFLIAAANRLAKALAFVRTGEEEPPPEQIRRAKRDVIGQCIYGVDINPMAVELCKVSLWLEALDPGKPLSFLDHHLQVGNSLLGTSPQLMAQGIPDGAFKVLAGDDKPYAASLRKRNRAERKEREQAARQGTLFESPSAADYGYLGAAFQNLNTMSNAELTEVQRQADRYTALAQDPEYVKARLLADAWCAAFVWEKQRGILPLTDRLYRQLEEDPQSPHLQAVREQVVSLAERYGFFHWHVAFPDVFRVPEQVGQAENELMGWDGGFDVVLGNPPWEHTEIKEKEWFAGRVPKIANASSTKRRKDLIAELEEDDPYLYRAFIADKRIADSFSHFVRASKNYPLTGRGRTNTYPLFSEKSRHLTNSYGRAGLIVPSGIATDDTTKFFFQSLMQSRSLASLYDFENRAGIFSEVHRSYKFSLLTMTGWQAPAEAEFVFFAQQVADLNDAWRRFTLSAEEIAALNPNTGTMAAFRNQHDAEITKSIYQRVPVLIREQPAENLWNIVFKQGLFNMSSDSAKFQTRQALEMAEYKLGGNHFVRGEKRYLPLYEGRMIHQFTHRWATYESDGSTREMRRDELRDPYILPMPRYWVSQTIVQERTSNPSYLIGFRDVTNNTNERTMVAGIFPYSAVGHKLQIINLQSQVNTTQQKIGFYSNLGAFAFDYVARQKIGGMSFSFYILKQLPIIPPHTYTPALLDFIVPRVLELTYTAWDLQAFAQDLGYTGPPFLWDEDRRFHLRCELDALYFHLYQIPREDVDYIMETFPIVKRKDEAGHGVYRTKAVILALYDSLAALPAMTVPAPQDEGDGYDVPDVGGSRFTPTPVGNILLRLPPCIEYPQTRRTKNKQSNG